MRILVTNDDGIDAPGLRPLTAALVADGHEVAVVAPMSDRSGSGAGLGSIVDGVDIPYRRTSLPGLPGVYALAVDAPPAFAVLACCTGVLIATPDVVVSGINDGFNTGRLVLTSSTVGAALMAGGLGVRGIAVSAGFAPEHRFDTAARVAAATVSWLGEHGPPRTVLNVNVPNLSVTQLRGVRVAPLSPRGLMGLHLDKRADAVRLHRFENLDRLGEGTDSAVVMDGFASISVMSPIGTSDPDRDVAQGVERILRTGPVAAIDSGR